MGTAGRPAMPTIAERLLLALAVAWAVGGLCVSISFLWSPRGGVGIAANYGGRITNVVPGSPADLAHIAPGDRIVLPQTPFETRTKLLGAGSPFAPGTVLHVTVEHDGVVRSVALTARVHDPGVAERVSLLLGSSSTLISIVVGTLLILLRPSLVTWGFGLFELLSNPVIPALSRFPSAAAHLTYVSIYDVVQNVGVVGLLVFALNFPRPLRLRWRMVLVRLLPVIFVVLALWTLWIDYAVCVFAIPAHLPNDVLQGLFAIVEGLAIYLISERYVRGSAEDRPRLRWILVGFYVGLVCSFVGNLLVYTANAFLPDWVDALLIASEVTLPLTVAYAVVRHRVIDVDIFFSRALVYGLFTTLLVITFAAIDWLFTRVLEDFRLSIVFDALASIGIAIFFDRAHKMLEDVVASVVFRARSAAYDRLERTGRTFRIVSEPATIDASLVREPCEALAIDAAALFRRDGNLYRRMASAGWGEGDCATLDPDDRLVLESRTREGIVHLAEIPWDHPGLPAGVARPVLSIPLQAADRLTGLLLCSRKRNGEDIDPEELERLVRFAQLAAVAYDRLDAERLRKDAESLELEVEVLRARLDEARRVPVK
jgi:hypothetical protein